LFDYCLEHYPAVVAEPAMEVFIDPSLFYCGSDVEN